MATELQKTNSAITTVRMNGLVGRMLRLPSKSSKREILVLYDAHMDLESVQVFAKKMNRYGTITVVDLPGFGGMDSFYKIKQKPSLDNYAAYVAAFVKLRFRNKRITIVGIGVGGTIAVQTLQKYAYVRAKTNALLILGSLVEKTDRRMSRMSRLLTASGYNMLLLRPISFIGRTVIMRGPFLRVALGLSNLQSAPLPKDEVVEEDRLWRGQDLRSHLYVQRSLLVQAIAPGQLQTPAFAIAINTPKDFDYSVWHEHLKIIFSDVSVVHSRRKVAVKPSGLFEQLTPDAKKFLRQ